MSLSEPDGLQLIMILIDI